MQQRHATAYGNAALEVDQTAVSKFKCLTLTLRWLTANLASPEIESDFPGVPPKLSASLFCEPQIASLRLSSESDEEFSVNLPSRLISKWKEFSLSFVSQGKPTCALTPLIVEQLTAVFEATQSLVRKRSTQQNVAEVLEQKQQASLYNLAYGLSHELNNPLAIISAQASALSQRLDDPDVVRQLDNIVMSAGRGAEMIRDLMLVARPASLKLTHVDLKQLVVGLVEKAQEWAKQLGVEIQNEFESTVKLDLDPAAIREALWALVRNALQASDVGSTIRIDGTIENQTIRLSIEDEGSGLTAEALKHCFDPYFCGREAGRGLGLGLAKAMRIITLHGGNLLLTNRPAVGCSAIVELPTNSAPKSC